MVVGGRCSGKPIGGVVAAGHVRYARRIGEPELTCSTYRTTRRGGQRRGRGSSRFFFSFPRCHQLARTTSHQWVEEAAGVFRKRGPQGDNILGLSRSDGPLSGRTYTHVWLQLIAFASPPTSGDPDFSPPQPLAFSAQLKQLVAVGVCGLSAARVVSVFGRVNQLSVAATAVTEWIVPSGVLVSCTCSCSSRTGGDVAIGSSLRLDSDAFHSSPSSFLLRPQLSLREEASDPGVSRLADAIPHTHIRT